MSDLVGNPEDSYDNERKLADLVCVIRPIGNVSAQSKPGRMSIPRRIMFKIAAFCYSSVAHVVSPIKINDYGDHKKSVNR